MSVAVVLEALGGWVGFLGVGHLVSGQIVTGLILMVLWWMVGLLLFFVVLGSLGAGLGCAAPIWFVVPVLSALALANRSR
jgi:TM2 domain-containing membrane protein YozV